MSEPKQCNVGSKYISEREMLRRQWVHLDRVVEFVSQEAADAVEAGIKSALDQGWIACAVHQWQPVAENYFRCSVCGAVGYKKLARSSIFIYQCPVCRNDTTAPGEACPNCAPDPDGVIYSRIPKNLTWDHLTARQQRALRYLFEKKEPTTISNSEGGGATLRFLAQRGMVQRAGEKSGQAVWMLTEEARKRYDVELRKI